MSSSSKKKTGKLKPKTASVVTINPSETRNVRQEELSHISHETFRDAIVAPNLRRSLQEVVKRVHLDPDRPWNVNAYVASQDASMGLCYAKGRWMPMRAEEIARLVLTNAASLMCEHNDDPYEDEYDQEQTERFDEFFDRLERDGVALRDTLKTLAEGRDIVERIHGCSRMSGMSGMEAALPEGPAERDDDKNGTEDSSEMISNASERNSWPDEDRNE
jgi:hypothetical protein